MKTTSIFFFVFLFLSTLGFSQSKKTLESQVEFCNYEMTQLEKEYSKLKDLLDMQTKMVSDLKIRVVTMEEEKAKEAQAAKNKEQVLASSLLRAAIRLDKAGDTEGAKELYELIIRSFPETTEAYKAEAKLKSLMRWSDSGKKKRKD